MSHVVEHLQDGISAELYDDLQIVKAALFEFLRGDFTSPLNELTERVWSTGAKLGDRLKTKETRFYLVYGVACLMVNKAVLTFNVEDVDCAKHYVDQAKNSAYHSTPGWWKSRHTDFERYSLTELHAQMVSAECDFLSGLLHILKSLILMHKKPKQIYKKSKDLLGKLFPKITSGKSFEVLSEQEIPTVAHFYGAECLYTLLEPNSFDIRTGVSILWNHFSRLAKAGLCFLSAHKSFEHLKKIVESSNWDYPYYECNKESKANWALFHELKTGVNVIIGSIYLFADVLPNKCMSMLQMVHKLDSDKDEGIRLLVHGLEKETMRKVLAVNCLLSYNLTFLQFVGPISDYSVLICDENVTYLTSYFNEFFVTDYYVSQFHKMDNRDRCEKSLIRLSNVSYTEPVLLHVKLIGKYELMWFYAYDFNWAEASECATVLATQTLWSRAYFIYLSVLFKSFLIENIEKFRELVNNCQNLEQVFACADSQIKPIATDRLAAKRIKDLKRILDSAVTLDNYPKFWFILEAMFWHDEFRGWSEQSRGDLLGIAEHMPGLRLMAAEINLMEKASNDKIRDLPVLLDDAVGPGIDNIKTHNFDTDHFKDGLEFVIRCALRLELIKRTFHRHITNGERYYQSVCASLIGSLKALRAIEKSCIDPDLLILAKFLCLKLCFVVSQIKTKEISEFRDELDARIADFLKNVEEPSEEDDNDNKRDSWLHLQLVSSVYSEKEICKMVLSYISVFKKSSLFSNPQSVYAGRTYCFLRNLSGEIEERLRYIS